jgi:glutaredoxin
MAEEEGRCLSVELYFDPTQESQRSIVDALDEVAEAIDGISLRHMEANVAANQDRLERICKHFSLEPKALMIYGSGRAFSNLRDAGHARECLDQIRTLTMYGRSGCPRCAAAKEYLKSYARKYPGLRVVMHDISADGAANVKLQSLLAKHRTTAASIPVFHICDQVVVGWGDATTSSRRLEAILEKWSSPCKKKTQTPSSLEDQSVSVILPFMARPLNGLLLNNPQQERFVEPASQEPLPLPQDPNLPLPKEENATAPDEISLPYFGPVRLSRLGLPFFTIAVGLVDGFNPCAMWVLVFLLSVLVNLHHRGKILAVAGTFVFVSGAFYFAFMAAWINVFQFIGMTRAIQIVLASLAIVIGLIHVKDFFAFKKGVSLSIPDSSKPRIYEGVRKIVNAENLTGAVVGAATLAALVNFVELLCTAGLPALYTQILFSQELPNWKNYAYLLLYNLAYMFDDALMVSVVVVTLGRGKMQETHGRWLKLVSGMAILLLGFVMLLRPQWLGM